MTRTRLIIELALALAVAVAAPGPARAQDAAPPLEENPRAAHFNDVERGWFVGFEAGYLSYLQTRVADPAAHGYTRGTSGGKSGGLHLALNIGRDFTHRLAVSLFGQGDIEKGGPNYGAFSVYAGGLDVRYAFYGKKDRNDWERFFLYVHARGGYAQTYPKGLFGTTDTIVQAGPGFEYFTRLRHFSVGASVDYVRALKAKANGFAIYPTVRYTF
jgi:hypothetical protein